MLGPRASARDRPWHGSPRKTPETPTPDSKGSKRKKDDRDDRDRPEGLMVVMDAGSSQAEEC